MVFKRNVSAKARRKRIRSKLLDSMWILVDMAYRPPLPRLMSCSAHTPLSSARQHGITDRHSLDLPFLPSEPSLPLKHIMNSKASLNGNSQLLLLLRKRAQQLLLRPVRNEARTQSPHPPQRTHPINLYQPAGKTLQASRLYRASQICRTATLATTST